MNSTRWILRAWGGALFETIAIVPDTDKMLANIIREAYAMAAIGYRMEVSVKPHGSTDTKVVATFGETGTLRPFDITTDADWKVYEEVMA